MAQDVGSGRERGGQVADEEEENAHSHPRRRKRRRRMMRMRRGQRIQREDHEIRQRR